MATPLPKVASMRPRKARPDTAAPGRRPFGSPFLLVRLLRSRNWSLGFGVWGLVSVIEGCGSAQRGRVCDVCAYRYNRIQ
jgi:hypothetical protein